MLTYKKTKCSHNTIDPVLNEFNALLLHYGQHCAKMSRCVKYKKLDFLAYFCHLNEECKHTRIG